MAEFKPIPDQKISHENFTLTYSPFGYVTVPSFSNPSKFAKEVLPEPFMQVYDEIKNLQCYDDDVWVAGHPKTGTTWLLEMVWLLNNNLDFDRALKNHMSERFPYIEGSALVTFFPPNNGTLKAVKELPRPRLIRTHLIAELLPDKVWETKTKIFFITREPKDAAVSHLHFSPVFIGYTGTREQFFEGFMNDQLPCGGYFDHIEGYWARRNHPNVMFLHYEELKQDLKGVMKRAAEFLGKTYTDEQYEQLAKHLSIDSMRENPTVNMEHVIPALLEAQNLERNDDHAFIRKGGTHKKDMTPEEIARFDQWTQEKLKNTDFRFKA